MNLSIKKKILFSSFIPLIACLAIIFVIIVQNIKVFNETNSTSKNLKFLISVSNLVTEIQRERGLSAGFNNGGIKFEKLNSQRETTDEKIIVFNDLIDKNSLDKSYIASIQNISEQLKEVRISVDNNDKLNSIIPKFNNKIEILLKSYSNIVKVNKITELNELFTSTLILEHAKEKSGQLRAVMVGVLSQNTKVSKKTFTNLITLKSSKSQFINSPNLKITDKSNNLIKKFKTLPHWVEIDETVDTIIEKSEEGEFGKNAGEFYSTITLLVNNIGELIDVEIKNLESTDSTIHSEALKDIIYESLFSVLFVSGMLFLLNWIGNRISTPITRASNIMKEISEGNLDHNIENNLTDEVGELMNSIDSTISGMRDVFQSKQIDWHKISEMKQLEKEARENAQKEKEEALKAKKDSELSAKKAEEESLKAKNALVESKKANESAQNALKQSKEDKALSERAAEEAEIASKSAQDAQESAEQEKAKAQEALNLAEIEKKKAQEAKKEISEIMKKQENITNENNRRVDVILDVVQKASEGNLSDKIEITGSDPIGKVAEGIKVMLKNLINQKNQSTKLIESLSEASIQLTNSSQKLANTSEEMNKNAGTTKMEADHASKATDGISMNIQMVASSSEEMSASIKEISNSMTNTSEKISQTMSEASRSDDIMKNLSKSSLQIGDVIKVINSIAQQTNLLALNATIEAARAGEAGRGFAVVANEVKELANQTAAATDEITKKVNAIQEDTKNSVQAIKVISQSISEINGISTQISASIEEQNATTAELTKLATASSENVSSTSKSISIVENTASKTASGSEALVDAAKDLHTISNTLSSLVLALENDSNNNQEGATNTIKAA